MIFWEITAGAAPVSSAVAGVPVLFCKSTASLLIHAYMDRGELILFISVISLEIVNKLSERLFFNFRVSFYYYW